MTLKIIELNGNEIDISDYARVLDFYVEPLVPIYDTYEIEGGQTILKENGHNIRRAVATLRFSAYVMETYATRLAELRALLSHTRPFYLIDMRDSSKRWFVRNEGDFKPDRKSKTATMTVAFICINKYGESIGTTRDAKTWSANKWSWGSGLKWSVPLEYDFTSNNFIVNNIGTAVIDPRESKLKITIKATASNYLEIRNKTTGDILRYNGSLISAQTLVLDSINVTRNGVNVWANTNKKVLTLAPGENEFEVLGGTIISAAFDFRFLYL